MKKIVLIAVLLFGAFVAMNSYADSFDPSGTASGIAGSFQPGGVYVGGNTNDQMNGSGSGDNQDKGPNFTSHKSFFTPSVADSSVTILGDIFGNVGDVINGSGVPLLSQLFGIFNTALMGLGVIIITYLVFRGILDTAAHGEFLGKQMNSVWVPVRVVMGVMLLIPRKGGYCVAQTLILYVILMGVGVADTVWDKALTYFQNGGAMTQVDWHSSKQKTKSANVNLVCSIFPAMCANYNKQIDKDHSADSLAYQQQVQNIESVAKQVFSSLVCMQSFATHKNSGAFIPPKITTSNNMSTYNFTVNAGNKNFSCGSVSWKSTGLTGGAATTAMESMVSQLIPASKSAVDAQASSDGAESREQAAYAAIGSNFISSMAQQYIGTITNAITSKSRTNDHNKFMDNARNIGWIFAGAYFHDIISLQNKVFKQIPVPMVGAHDNFMTDYYNYSDEHDDYDFASHFATDLQLLASKAPGNPDSSASASGTSANSSTSGSSSHSVGSVLPPVVKHSSKKEKVATGTSCHKGVCHTTYKEKHVAVESPADKIYAKVKVTFDYLFFNMQVQPILAIQNVGAALVRTVSKIYSSIASINETKKDVASDKSAVSGAMSLIPFFGSSLSGIENAKMQAQLSEMTSFQGLLIAIASALMLPAATLAVYIPLLPYILFMIGALGWVLTVFEAVIAAPLVSLGIVHPEGHDVYGKSQPAVMLLANAFIKPMLMVIGLLSAILISNAAISLFNAGFAMVLKTTYNFNVFADLTGTSMAIMSVLFLFIYVGLILAIVNKSFQLIYAIPDKVLRWLDNFVPSGQEEAQMLQEVKGQFTQDVNEGKQVASKGMETSVSMNDAENKQTQEVTTAGFGLAKSMSSGAGGGSNSSASSSGMSLEEAAFL